jgi:2-aminoethylphosphonate-pyruvate transaminase
MEKLAMKDPIREMKEPILLTPGPLTTSRRTKEAMLRDWGSWDADFNQITGRIREQVVRIAHGEGTHECVPLQGSGTFAVEAAIGTLVPRDGHVLVPANGAYCDRIAKICRYLGRRLTVHAYAEDAQVRPEDIDRLLAQDPGITHVALVHCETSTGILNPLQEIAAVVAARGRRLIADAMSSFGALDIDARNTPFDALVAASGKCLEGVPGMGFVIVRREALEKAAGNAHSLAMDLHDQWTYMEKTTQWRYTPPTSNCRELIGGMQALGFRSFLPSAIQAPIIVTFHAPSDPNYDFKRFYAAVKQRGYILYPGKLTQVETFRVGCMGHFGDDGIKGAVRAIAETLREQNIRLHETGAVRSRQHAS